MRDALLVLRRQVATRVEPSVVAALHALADVEVLLPDGERGFVVDLAAGLGDVGRPVAVVVDRVTCARRSA